MIRFNVGDPVIVGPNNKREKGIVTQIVGDKLSVVAFDVYDSRTIPNELISLYTFTEKNEIGAYNRFKTSLIHAGRLKNVKNPDEELDKKLREPIKFMMTPIDGMSISEINNSLKNGDVIPVTKIDIVVPELTDEQTDKIIFDIRENIKSELSTFLFKKGGV